MSLASWMKQGAGLVAVEKHTVNALTLKGNMLIEDTVGVRHGYFIEARPPQAQHRTEPARGKPPDT